MFEKLSKASQNDLTQSALWALAFVGVCVLVGLGKVDPSVLQNMLFALIGGMAMKRKSTEKSDATPSE